jgi:hypothetical protein
VRGYGLGNALLSVDRRRCRKLSRALPADVVVLTRTLRTLEEARDICAFWKGGEHLDPRCGYRVRELHRGLRSRAVCKTRYEPSCKSVTGPECINGLASNCGMKNACCGLCGYTGTLSRTHIPPKAAGNQGRARRLLELIDEHGTSHLHLKNAGTGGGGWGEWLCEPCNNKTGEWAEEYGEWSRNIVLRLHDGGVQHGRDLPMHLQNVAPGAVVRAMWAWMFALDPNLRLNEPDLATAVLSGDPVGPPSDKKLLIGATTSLGIWVSGQVGGHAFRTPIGGRVPSYKTASGIRVVGPEEVDAPEVAVSSPPEPLKSGRCDLQRRCARMALSTAALPPSFL